jgi:hypothetical protein
VVGCNAGDMRSVEFWNMFPFSRADEWPKANENNGGAFKKARPVKAQLLGRAERTRST